MKRWKWLSKRAAGFLLAALIVGGAAASAQTAQAAVTSWSKVNTVCYNGNGKKIPNAVTRGIDVSSWQGTINWSKVANSDVDFAFLRVGHSYGTTLTADSYLNYNLKNATAAGIPVGVYYYSGAKTTAQAVKEADYVIEKIQGYKISYPVVFDLEAATILQGLTDTNRANIAMAFCNQVKAAGYYPMLYCNTYWYNNYINTSIVSGVDKWLAAYGDSKTSAGTNATHTIWQATDGAAENGLKTTRGLIRGIPTENTVDIDFGYVDYTKVVVPRSYKATSTSITNNSTPVASSKNGWYKTPYGNWYYFKNGKKVTGWMTYNSEKYYFNSKGTMLKGLQKIGSYYYYFSPSKTDKYSEGARTTGWQKINGKWFYFKTSGSNVGTMQRYKWLAVNGKWYFLQKNGVMKTGWLNWNGNRYYLTSDGSMRVGWLQYSGKYYYFQSPNGAMARSTVLTIAGKQYKFDANGIYYK